jgi:ethanolamine ammonia-lyase large subunit
MAAQMALAEVPLARFLEEALVPYEKDEVTRLIFGSHDRDALIQISHMYGWRLAALLGLL